MRRSIAVLCVFLAAAALSSVARGDGSPYAPGLVYGASGVRAPEGRLRYVTLSTPRSTVVAAIRVRDGRIVRSNVLGGFYGVPIVAFDNSTAGVSGDGHRLALASYGPFPGAPGSTRFVLLDTKTLRKIRTFVLEGSWAFDAISPDGSKIFLVEYLAAGRSPHYRVRLLDAETGRLDPDPVVDRRDEEVVMRGQPVTRKPSGGGKWAFTLYARSADGPFVHALDTEAGKAYCIDLPLDLKQLEQMALRLRVSKGANLDVVNPRGAVLARVSVERLG